MRAQVRLPSDPREHLEHDGPQRPARNAAGCGLGGRGAPGYRLTLEVTDGALVRDGRISAGADGRIRLRVTALSGETPLTPLSDTALVNGKEIPAR